MTELICNLHIHSTYSDGSGNYTSILQEASASGVDVVIITDHNILVKNVERYSMNGDRRTLLLAGEEVHHQDREPQKNHLLVIGGEHEVSQYAPDPQVLIDQAAKAHGLTFIAHPYEYPLPLFGETAISWVDWQVQGFTGLELWNGFSEFKTVTQSLPKVLFYAFFPTLIPHGPLPQAFNKWDELLKTGKKVVAVTGSDAHALHYRKGFFKKTIFPYRYHFSSINNHLLVEKPLTGEIDEDKRMIYQALSRGNSFIGFDRAAPTSGFTFTAENEDATVSMGETLSIERGATIRVRLPRKANIRLIHNGSSLLSHTKIDRLVHTVTEPGYYRLEAYIPYYGKYRGWVFSNPIYILKNGKVSS